MNRSHFTFVGAAILALCLSAYLAGWLARVPTQVDLREPPQRGAGTPVISSPSPDFAHVVTREITRISFAQLYETLRGASPADQERWLSALDEMPENCRKVETICSFLRVSAQVDPAQAVDLALHLRRHRSPAIDAIITAAPPAAMPRLAEKVLRLPDAVRNYNGTDHLPIVLDEWAQIDPEAVARFLENHPELPSEEYADTFVEAWAAIDHAAALRWLDTHAPGVASNDWLRGWWSADPDAAIAFALANVEAESFDYAINDLASEIFQDSPAKAKDFIQHLPEGNIQQKALQYVAGVGSNRESFRQNLAPGAANLIIQFPPEVWPDHFSEVLGRWKDSNSTELFEWISHLPAETQQQVIGHFPVPYFEAPEKDLLIVLQIADAAVREKLLHHLVETLGSDRESAGNAIARLKLSAEQKAELARYLVDEEH